jgi:arylsulfatase A-like enzyme
MCRFLRVTRVEWAWLVALCLLVACRHDTAPPNVIVILVDTLRADRLGAYGNTRGLTPTLDALAGRSFVFRHAYAASSWTQPSVASLFTSRFQSQHGIIHVSATLNASEVTLAEVLHDRGYATAAFSANALIARNFGYAQGFDHYTALWGKRADEEHPHGQTARASEINALVEAWLDQPPVSAGKPFFLYVHYLEPHGPYAPPQEFLDRVFAGRPHSKIDSITTKMFFGNWDPPNADELREIEDVYDAEVASVDAGIGELYAALEQRGLLRNAVVAFTADHGEGFREHGLVSHGASLYEEVIHVPLLLTFSGRAERVDVDETVSLLDVAPTLLDVVGGAVPQSFEGRRLPAVHEARHPWLAALAAWWSPSGGSRAVFSELVCPEKDNDQRLRPHERAVISRGRKLIVGIHGEREAYDLVADPGEHTALDEPEATRLADVLGDFGSRVPLARLQPPPVDAELRARLRALGYFD